jgi:hypothetical protein
MSHGRNVHEDVADFVYALVLLAIWFQMLDLPLLVEIRTRPRMGELQVAEIAEYLAWRWCIFNGGILIIWSWMSRSLTNATFLFRLYLNFDVDNRWRLRERETISRQRWLLLWGPSIQGQLLSILDLLRVVVAKLYWLPSCLTRFLYMLGSNGNSGLFETIAVIPAIVIAAATCVSRFVSTFVL